MKMVTWRAESNQGEVTSATSASQNLLTLFLCDEHDDNDADDDNADDGADDDDPADDGNCDYGNGDVNPADDDNWWKLWWWWDESESSCVIEWKRERARPVQSNTPQV